MLQPVTVCTIVAFTVQNNEHIVDRLTAGQPPCILDLTLGVKVDHSLIVLKSHLNSSKEQSVW